MVSQIYSHLRSIRAGSRENYAVDCQRSLSHCESAGWQSSLSNADAGLLQRSTLVVSASHCTEQFFLADRFVPGRYAYSRVFWDFAPSRTGWRRPDRDFDRLGDAEGKGRG